MYEISQSFFLIFVIDDLKSYFYIFFSWAMANLISRKHL